MTAITIQRVTTAVQAVAIQAMRHEDLADVSASMGKPGAKLAYHHEADRLWESVFRGIGNDGAQWDRRRK